MRMDCKSPTIHTRTQDQEPMKHTKCSDRAILLLQDDSLQLLQVVHTTTVRKSPQTRGMLAIEGKPNLHLDAERNGLNQTEKLSKIHEGL